MKTYRLLFSAPMARAVMSGAKSQTRRFDRRLLNAKPGDLLLGKETWKTDVSLDQVPPSAMDPGSTQVLYLADGAVGGIAWDNMQPGKTRVSIHMPDWACRIRARIVSVREEALQDITEEDAKAEGCEPSIYPESWTVLFKNGGSGSCFVEPAPSDNIHSLVHVPASPMGSARDAFRTLWIGLHGLENWNANPAVVRVEFAPEVTHV